MRSALLDGALIGLSDRCEALNKAPDKDTREMHELTVSLPERRRFVRQDRPRRVK